MQIVEAKTLERYQVFLRFQNGETGVVNLDHLAGRGVFKAWHDAGHFEKLSISPIGALQWPGELDLCPDALYLQMTGKTPAELFPSQRDSLSHA